MPSVFRYPITYLHSAYVLSVMLYSGEAVRLVGRKPLKTSSSVDSERVTETEDFYYQRGFS